MRTPLRHDEPRTIVALHPATMTNSSPHTGATPATFTAGAGEPAAPDAATRAALRHVVATLAYRAAKVLRDAPPAMATFSLTPHTRLPVQVVAHMGDLMDWAIEMARGRYHWSANGSDDWDAEVARFFERLATLDALLASPPAAFPAEMMIQGPLADALTHVGQLAMMRGAMGAPVRPESYARAEIVAGRVGRVQAAAKREFDGDASERR